MELHNNNKKITKVWCDGCYDMVHFGHANQMRQAKSFGDYLIVGVHTDKEISLNKGPPIFNEQERYKMVRAIKWVDEVVEGAPYITSLEFLKEYDCDFCVHGNDITLDGSGQDTYRYVKEAGKYKECERTAGISTTELVRRILQAKHHGLDFNKKKINFDKIQNGIDSKISKPIHNLNEKIYQKSPWTTVHQFLPSTKKIFQFSDNKEPLPGDRIAYVSGSFDLFHVGHVDFLSKIKKISDYLIVGLFDDNTVNKYWGSNYPIMTLQERILSVLACKYVNEVVIGAPYIINKELLDHFRIDIVCEGVNNYSLNVDDCDPFIVAKNLNKFKIIDSENDLTTAKIVDRIINNQIQFIKRNNEKEMKESKIYEILQKNGFLENN